MNKLNYEIKQIKSLILSVIFCSAFVNFYREIVALR
ncbi:Hypothetical Protein XCAW_02170 [Xanthomonas citri subsp. citri Aw12879]|nr:Hypothetical Protein XCAW_02170 [Xanthomonas citri subsp. citri Aw12879]